MSVSRASVARQTRSLRSFRSQSRNSHHDAHHHHAEDTTVYPKEGFSSPFWRNSVLALVGIIGVAKFTPADFLTGTVSTDGSFEQPWLTRVLAHHGPSLEEWVSTNERHLEQTQEIAQNTLLMQNAKLPAVTRTKHPRKWEQVSPHRVPVGGRADLSDLVVKPTTV